MRKAPFPFLSPVAFASPSWERSSPREVPVEKAASPRRARPLLAALLMVTAGALLVGGCVVAARIGGASGAATALLGFVSYLVVFARGLDQLPLDWHSWRERDYR